MQKISKSIDDTAKIAKEFMSLFTPEAQVPATLRRGATVVGLYGNLGAGKTAFTQAVAKHFKIKRKVASPTFVIMKRYPLDKTGIFKNLFHIDAYRLKNEKEILHLGWEEIIKNPENIIFIEWPERIKKAMPKKHHKIKISHIKEGHRKFVVN